MSTRRRYKAVEGEVVKIDPGHLGRLRQAVFRLRTDFKMGLPALDEDASGLRVRNLIGAIDLGDGVILDVEPKTRPGTDWVRSVLSLLLGDDPVDAASDRSGNQDAARPDLIEAVSAIYAARLEKALRRDGPLLTMRRTAQSGALLKGKLNVDRWVAGVFANPAQFPVSYDQLTPDNEFTSAMAHVCDLLRNSSRKTRSRSRLAQLASALRAGSPSLSAPLPGIEHRRLPSQWAVYEPAWAVACAVLARRSLLGPTGRLSGVSIAIEAWPLLERLLERSVHAAAQSSSGAGRSLLAPPKRFAKVLSRASGAGKDHTLEPDALLAEAGRAVIAFEAKYREFDPAVGPLRGEIYQALAAARAVSAPVSVLVYPNRFDTISWVVVGAGAPTRVYAVGLDLFAYVRGGEATRGAELLKCLAPDPCHATILA